MSEVEYRAAQLASVSFPQRLVELIVMPYETETQIFEQGRAFAEVVSRGAFAGIEARNDRVRVNRDHDRTKPVGRAVALHPSRQEGLVAEIRISKTDEGDDTLELAGDGVLDASAGFALMRKDGRTGPVLPDAEVWETRSRRRLNHLYLHHIAMVMDPAYEGARTLAVRQAAPEELVGASVVAAPNRALLELQQWREQESVLDARYSPLQH